MASRSLTYSSNRWTTRSLSSSLPFGPADDVVEPQSRSETVSLGGVQKGYATPHDMQVPHQTSAGHGSARRIREALPAPTPVVTASLETFTIEEIRTIDHIETFRFVNFSSGTAVTSLEFSINFVVSTETDIDVVTSLPTSFSEPSLSDADPITGTVTSSRLFITRPFTTTTSNGLFKNTFTSTFSTTTPTGTFSPNTNNDQSATSGNPSSLSPGVVAGMAVGIGLVVVCLALAVQYYCCIRRRMSWPRVAQAQDGGNMDILGRELDVEEAAGTQANAESQRDRDSFGGDFFYDVEKRPQDFGIMLASSPVSRQDTNSVEGATWDVPSSASYQASPRRVPRYAADGGTRLAGGRPQEGIDHVDIDDHFDRDAGSVVSEGYTLPPPYSSRGGSVIEDGPDM